MQLTAKRHFDLKGICSKTMNESVCLSGGDGMKHPMLLLIGDYELKWTDVVNGNFIMYRFDCNKLFFRYRHHKTAARLLGWKRREQTEEGDEYEFCRAGHGSGYTFSETPDTSEHSHEADA